MTPLLDELFGGLICPHCGFEIRNAKKICPKCKNNIEDAKKESIPNLIIGGISLSIGLLTSFLASKIGIESNLFLILIFVGVGWFVRPFVRNMIHKK